MEAHTIRRFRDYFATLPRPAFNPDRFLSVAGDELGSVGALFLGCASLMSGSRPYSAGVHGHFLLWLYHHHPLSAVDYAGDGLDSINSPEFHATEIMTKAMGLSWEHVCRLCAMYPLPRNHQKPSERATSQMVLNRLDHTLKHGEGCLARPGYNDRLMLMNGN